LFKRGYIHNFSQALLFVSGLIYFVNYLMDGRLSELFLLQPSKVINNMELWRLVTFPLSFSTLEGFLLFIFTFRFISPKVEEILHRGIYPFIIASLTCLQGTLITIFFWESPIRFYGMDGISFFVLYFFAFIQFNRKIVIWRVQPLKMLVFISLLTFSWFAVVFIHGYALNRDILVSSITSAMFGFAVSLLLYSQYRLVYKLKAKKDIPLPRFEIPDAGDDMSMAYISHPEQKRFNNSVPNESNQPDYEFNMNEERLNEILDKINASGTNSLYPEELSYLTEYSKKL